MNDEAFESPTPPGEAWWERELHRNEKLMDRYMKVFEDEGDAAFEKYDTPDKLYNKVHYGIEPGEPLPPEVLAREAGLDPDFETWKEEAMDAAAAAAEEVEDKLDAEQEPAESEGEEEWDEESFQEYLADPGRVADEAAYQPLAKQARAFAVKVMQLSERPEIEEVLLLSATRIGANLAGGHGLGYGEATLCGNIVKCRWALADCEFCREMFEQLAARHDDAFHRELAAGSATLSAAIRERIELLRARVWW